MEKVIRPSVSFEDAKAWAEPLLVEPSDAVIKRVLDLEPAIICIAGAIGHRAMEILERENVPAALVDFTFDRIVFAAAIAVELMRQAHERNHTRKESP